MAHGRPRDPRKEQQWRRCLQLWQHSGLTVREFCDRHRLAEGSFYAWRRHLQQRDAAAAAFVSVHVVPDEQPQLASPLEVVVPGGRCVRVRNGFDPATLRRLLAVLEEAPPC
jgi:ferric-dicitrate binding protein FerR (iron transport regulator)